MAHKGVVFIALFSLVCGAQRSVFFSFVFVSLWRKTSVFNSFVFVSLWRTKEWFL